MPRRRAASRSTTTPSRLPVLVALALIVIGTAVLIARGRPERAAPSPPPTTAERVTAEPTRAQGQPNAPALAAVPQATPTPRPASAPTATPKLTLAATPRPTAAAAATAHATPAPSPTTAPTTAPQVVSGNVVALTFDAGADRGYADDILDLLHAERISASFGITGVWARANPDLVRRMAADGHLVINHSLDHQSFTGASDQRGGLSATRRRAELEDADALIAPLIGHSTRPWYRLPYGDDDARVATDVAPSGFTHKVGWTIDTLGWRGASAADIVDRSLRLAAPNAMYVLHVGHGSQDGPALGRIVTGLRERGYGFVSVDGLAH